MGIQFCIVYVSLYIIHVAMPVFSKEELVSMKKGELKVAYVVKKAVKNNAYRLC